MKATTARFYRDLAIHHLVPKIGGTLLAALTAPQLNRLYGDLLVAGGPGGRPLSPTAVHAVHMTISRALGDAMRWGKLSRNVARSADAPAPAREERRAWSADQLRAFLASVEDDQLRPLWHLAVTTGLRRGELAALRWADLDLDAGLGLGAGVDRHRACVCPGRWPGLPPTAPRSDLRPAGPGGRPSPAHTPWPQASFTTASLNAGVDLKTVSSRLRHSSVSITGDVYAHVLEHVDQAAAEMAAAFILGKRSG